MKIKISKVQWELIGKKAGWDKSIKLGMVIIREMYVSFVDDLLFEDDQDVKSNIRGGIDPSNIWVISYNVNALDDRDLIQDLTKRYWGKSADNVMFYKELFKASSIHAFNYGSGIKKSSEELVLLILETSDIGGFFEFIKENKNLYKEEAMREEEEMRYTGQEDGEDEKDTLSPQN